MLLARLCEALKMGGPQSPQKKRRQERLVRKMATPPSSSWTLWSPTAAEPHKGGLAGVFSSLQGRPWETLFQKVHTIGRRDKGPKGARDPGTLRVSEQDPTEQGRCRARTRMDKAYTPSTPNPQRIEPLDFQNDGKLGALRLPSCNAGIPP